MEQFSNEIKHNVKQIEEIIALSANPELSEKDKLAINVNLEIQK